MFGFGQKNGGRSCVRRFALCALLAVFPSHGQAQTLIEKLTTGTFGAAFVAEASCDVNPHRWISLNGGTILRLQPDHAIEFPPGSFVEYVDYRVLSVGETTMAMEIVNEYRKYADGKPVQWQLRLVDDRGYCWNNLRKPNAACFYIQIRCPTTPGTS